MSYQNLVLNLGVWPPVVTSSSLSPSRRLRKQYTHSTPTANPPRRGPLTPSPRAQSRHRHPKPGAAVVNGFCVLPHNGREGISTGSITDQGPIPGRDGSPVALKAEGPATKWLPALLKQLESAVLDYQEDLVMPGSSPR